MPRPKKTVTISGTEVNKSVDLPDGKPATEVLGNTNPELLNTCVQENEETDIFNENKYWIEDRYKKDKDIIELKNKNKLYQIPLSFQKKVRGWCLTIFSEKDNEPKFVEKDMKYLVYGSEIAPKTKKHHFQTYVYFHNPKTFQQVRTYFFKLLGFYPHIEKARGSIEENLAYCSKDGKYKEFGEKPAQGERTDLKAAIDDIKDGKIHPLEICDNNPEFYHQFSRTLNDARYINVTLKERTEMTQGYWYFGKSGVGKSHYVFNTFKDHYIFKGTKTNDWFDGYTGQETIIFNDFKGNYSFKNMLTLVDKWGEKLNVRGRENVNMISKNVVITASVHPKEIYKNSLKNRINGSGYQFYRRFKIYELLENPEDGSIVPCLIRPKIKESDIKSINNRNPKMKKEGDEWVLSEDDYIISDNEDKNDDTFLDD